MTMPPPSAPSTDREAQARAEIGHTAISPSAARIVTGVFLAVLVAVPLVHLVATFCAPADRREGLVAPWRVWRGAGTDLVRAWQGAAGPVDRIMAANRALLARIEDFNNELDDRFLLATAVRAPVQDLLVRLGAGNEQVLVGRGGWLFFSQDLSALTGPGFLDPTALDQRRRAGGSTRSAVAPDPLPAIRSFRDQLARHGIGLVLLPVPVKPAIHPERLAGPAHPVAVRNRSWPEFLARCAEAGILVYDPAPALLATKAVADAYLATDTHWSPAGMQAVAAGLAEDLVARGLVARGTTVWRRTPRTVVNRGDIWGMLRVGAGSGCVATETVSIATVTDAAGHDWRPQAGGPVLLLGDSFTNIYSTPDLGWGAAAGLAEQLSAGLAQPLDRLSRNDGGAHASRAMLAADLAEGRDGLAGTRVVVWEFTERELVHGDWREITLPPRPAGQTAPPPPDPGAATTVVGRIETLSPLADLRSSPYVEHLRAVLLTGIEPPGATGATAVVYVLAVHQRQPLPPASWQVGDTVRLRLRPWAAVRADYGTVSRGELELDDPALMRSQPWFGEWVAP